MQRFKAVVVGGEGFGVAVKSRIEGDQATIEFFGQRIDLQGLAVNGYGLLTKTLTAGTRLF